MDILERKTETHLVRILWNIIKQHKSATVPATKLLKVLTTETALTEAEAEVLLHNATEDGFIEICGGNANNSMRNIRKSPTRAYRIPTDPGDPIKDLPHDLYCFECHCPSNLLKCSECPRVFHEYCMHCNNIVSPTTIRSPTNQQENTNDSGIAGSEPSLVTNDTNPPQGDSRRSREASVEAKPTMKTENANLCDDITSSTLAGHIKPDVICMGEVRPPSRRKRRLTSSYNKPQLNILVDSAGNENSLCSSCRLLHSSALRDPPLQLNEINYLLKFIFARIKTWITSDTYSPLPFSSIPTPPKQEFEFFESKCLKFPRKLDNIDVKLKTTGYKTLTEFQCDIMDIKHSIGILYGVKSAEYEAAGYLLRDCIFELSEIRNCPDCYRHSNEKTNEYWFCKPCIPRHELVFAKQIGYSHWPAKVIKVENGKYDVRFFGNQHLRAVIDAIHVLPIDTDIASLKIKQTAGFNKAMHELHRHQELLQWPIGQFSFEAERQNPVDLSGLRPSVENKKNRGVKGKKLNNSSMNTDGGDTTNEVSTSLNTSKALNVSVTNGASSEGSLSLHQISPVVRLKRAKNSGFNEMNNDNSIGVSPSKKPRPNLSSTPIKKRVVTQGRRRRASRTATENNSNTPSNQTNDDTSSTESQSTQPNQMDKGKLKLGKSKQDIIDNLIRELQAEKCSPTVCNLVASTFQAEMERSADRIKRLTRLIAENKKKQWCYNCGKEAMYHCCWNTAYCSTECQQKHWQMEHKKTCRRKR